MKRLLILLALLSYFPISELSAKKKAQDFCDSVPIGTPSKYLLENAVASGARRGSTQWEQGGNSRRRLLATYTGFYPGSDFICQITEKDGKVIEKTPSLITSLFQ